MRFQRWFKRCECVWWSNFVFVHSVYCCNHVYPPEHIVIRVWHVCPTSIEVIIHLYQNTSLSDTCMYVPSVCCSGHILPSEHKVISLACVCSFPALQWSCASIIKQLSDSVCAFPGVAGICAAVGRWRYQMCVCAFPYVTVIMYFHHKTVITLLCMCAFLLLQWCVPLNMTLSDSCVCVPFLVLQWSSEQKIISLTCICLSLHYSDQCLCQNMMLLASCAGVPLLQ